MPHLGSVQVFLCEVFHSLGFVLKEEHPTQLNVRYRSSLSNLKRKTEPGKHRLSTTGVEITGGH